MCKSNRAWNKKNNADLKAFSVPAHVNPGLENCINRLIMQYFCTCVIPFVMLKMHSGRGSAGMGGGNQGVLWGSQKGAGFAGNFIVLLCIFISMHVFLWVCACANIHF